MLRFILNRMSGITPIEQVRNENPLLWPALALLVIAIATFTYYWDGHRYQFPYSTKHGPIVWPPSSATLHEKASSGTPAQPDLGNFEALKMPGGADLNVPSNGMEAKLVAFIEDKSKSAGSDNSFNFDRLLFYPAAVTLAPASREQLHDIATILKVFSNVHVRIVGYPETEGDASANLKLAQDRAANVMNNLVHLGVSASRMQANDAGAANGGQAHGITLQVTQK